MTVDNARKRMATLGTVDEDFRGMMSVRVGAMVLSCWKQSNGQVTRFHTQRASEQADPQTDYFPGSYWDSFTAARSARAGHSITAGVRPGSPFSRTRAVRQGEE